MRQPTEHLPPVVALLAHRDCPCTGKGFEAGGGRVIEIAFAATAGYQADTIDLEDLVAHWSDVIDRTDLRIMPDMLEEARITPKPYIPE